MVASNISVALVLTGTAIGQTVDLGTQTGTSVQTSVPSGGGPPTTTTTTTYVSGPSAVQAQAAADKAKADLLTSQAQSRSAQITAANAALPAPIASGNVTLQGGSGTEEANVLAAVAINGAAARIVSKLGADSKTTFLIVTGGTLPDFSGWLTFDAKVMFLKDQLTKALSDYGQAHNQEPRIAEFEDLTGVGEAISGLVKLAQLAATDWNAGGVALQSDDYMLAVAVAARAPQAVIYNQSSSIDAYQQVKGRLDELDHLRQAAAADALASAKESNALQARAKKAKGAAADPDTKKASALDAGTIELNAAVAAYDGYLTTLSSSAAPASSGGGGAGLAAILQQYVAYQASTKQGVLLLRVHSASGGFYTKKNLWTAFGAMPFYVSGGVVVSYSFTKPTGRQASLFGVVVPYAQVGDVRTIADLDFNGYCDAAPLSGAALAGDIKQFCPLPPAR